MRNDNDNFIKRVPFLMLGAAILAFGMFNIHSRCAVTEGGILGLTLFIQHWTGLTPGVTGLLLDLTCYLIGYKMLGKTFLKSAIIASLSFSAFYNTFEFIGPVLPDFSAHPLVASLLGGLFVGIGCGTVVRNGGASGGDDALALIISKTVKCKISKAYLATDLTVLALSLSYIPVERIFYSLITVTISSFLIDFVQNFEWESLTKRVSVPIAEKNSNQYD